MKISLFANSAIFSDGAIFRSGFRVQDFSDQRDFFVDNCTCQNSLGFNGPGPVRPFAETKRCAE